MKMGPSMKIKQTRKRLTRTEMQVLEQEYLINPNWTTMRINTLAKKLRLCRTKVYKWGWDRKKKDGIIETSNTMAAPESDKNK